MRVGMKFAVFSLLHGPLHCVPLPVSVTVQWRKRLSVAGRSGAAGCDVDCDRRGPVCGWAKLFSYQGKNGPFISCVLIET